MHQCPYCPAQFDTGYLLGAHRRAHHPGRPSDKVLHRGPVRSELFALLNRDARAWMDLANCHRVDPVLFFPDRGASTREAKAVCNACEVREECLEYALAHGEKFGIWGGKSERERRTMRARRNRERVA